MAPPFFGPQGFGQGHRQGDSPNTGSAQESHTGGHSSSARVSTNLLCGRFGQGIRQGPASGHRPTHVAPGHFGQGLRPGAEPQHGSGPPGELTASSMSDAPCSSSPIGGPRPDLVYMRANSRRGGHLLNRTPSSRALGSDEPSQTGSSLDSIINTRTTSQRGGYTSNRLPSTTASRYLPAPTHRGGRLREQRGRPTSIGRAYNDDIARDYDANKRKRLGENLEEVTLMGPWLRAFKKRQKSAANEESVVVANSTHAPAQNSRQGPSDDPATAPTSMPKTKSVVESPVPCLELQGQTSIEPASITAMPQVDTSVANAPDVDTPDEAADVDIMLETSSTPEHRCSLPWDCKTNECVQR